MKLFDEETGIVRVPVVHSEIEVLLDGSEDKHLEEPLLELIADYLKTRAKGRWTIALDKDTKLWSWMND